MPLTEPTPLWPEAPLYCPQRKLPAYRFTPGLNHHPRGQVGGHAYGQVEEIPVYVSPQNWKKNEFYLHGIDLYHRGYLWESHEAWEALWHLTEKDNGEGQFLQGLIQNSAALLKAHLQQWSGARHLSQESFRRLQWAQKKLFKNVWMGLDLGKFILDLEACYAPLWKGEERIYPPPRMELDY